MSHRKSRHAARHWKYRSALCLNLAIRAALPALALGATTTARAQDAAMELDLPAQSLDSSLIQLGRQTSLQIFYEPRVVAGIQAPAVRGRMAPEQALRRLLQGSAIEYQRRGNNITLSLPATSGAAQLEPVLVTGAADDVTEGTGAYSTAGPSATATGLALTLRETPQSVTVMTRQRMEDFNLQTVAQVMEQTPGVYVEHYGDSVRFHARGGEINNFQIDGLRVSQMALASGAPTANGLSGDDTADMDRIEILKGSAGLLQGDGYPTATINMIRKKPTREFQAHMSLGGGTWNTYRSDIDVSGPLNAQGSLRGRAVASYKDGDSFRDRASNRNTLLYGVMEWDVTPATLFSASLSYKTLRNRGGAGWMGARAYDADGNREDIRSRSYNPAPAWSGYTQRVLTASSSLEHRISDDWTARIAANHQEARIPTWINAQIAMPGDAYISRFRDQKDTMQNVGLRLSGNIAAFGRKHELVLGYDFSKSRYDMERDNPADFSRYDRYASEHFYDPDGGADFPKPAGDEWRWSRGHHSETIRRGWYATGRIHATDSLKLILGARISDYSYRYREPSMVRGAQYLDRSDMRERGVITPYAGVVYDLSQDWTAYASYASVFQPVSVQDEQGQTLPPQKGTTYETGLKSDLLDGQLSFSVAHFWKRWERTYEESGGLTPTGDQAYRSVDGAMERGYEVELTGQPARGWQVQAGYVMNNSSLNGNTGKPRHQLKFAANYQFQGDLAGLTLGAAARWQSATEANSYARLEQPAYWVVDTMARYRFDRHWSASLNVNNVFDKKYYASVNGMAGWGMYYTWGAPRNAFLNVRYDF
ncbi:TonB-dependent siderophore receptor [Achromobacter sp. Marseille-Q0513]|uniref:TonB-dependent siderophore receptor n=1 Tax=Achromobacter sp. Marseille-Q0513 TaxID=2829161 RepID=UPI001B98954F|nr:TonB-dependent siderophore receptor [Achromobacter sp. Marseille-Q0513]